MASRGGNGDDNGSASPQTPTQEASMDETTHTEPPRPLS